VEASALDPDVFRNGRITSRWAMCGDIAHFGLPIEFESGITPYLRLGAHRSAVRICTGA
jgi:hypothetical protein